VTDLLDDATILAALAESLAPEPASPPVAAIVALHEALARRADDAVAAAVAPDATVAPVVALSSAGRWGRRGGALHRLRHPVAAAVAVAVLTTGGVAAAAVATDHLPGPTRAVAYDLGLPVTSPALAAAQGTLAALQAAVASGDVTRTRISAALLRTELAALSSSDRATIQASATAALTRADALVAPAPGTMDGATGTGATGTGGVTPGGGGVSGGTGGGVSGGTGGRGPSGSGSGAASGAVGPASSGGTTATTAPRSDDGSGPAPSSGDGGSSDDGGSDDGSGGTTTTTASGGTTTTTRPTGSDDGGSDDGGSDDGGSDDGGSDHRSGSTGDAVISTSTTLSGA